MTTEQNKSPPQHTPGPWYLVCDSDTDFTAIATTPTADRFAPDHEVLGTSEWLRAKREDLLLMAAAPELLEALENAAAWVDDDQLNDEIDRVIAKARGLA